MKHEMTRFRYLLELVTIRIRPGQLIITFAKIWMSEYVALACYQQQ